MNPLRWESASWFHSKKREGGGWLTIGRRPHQHRHLDKLARIKHHGRVIPNQVPIYTRSPVESRLLGPVRIRLRQVRSVLQPRFALPTETLHWLLHIVAAGAQQRLVELPAQVLDPRVRRYEHGFRGDADEEVVVAALMCGEVQGGGAGAGGDAVEDHVVGVAAELRHV